MTKRVNNSKKTNKNNSIQQDYLKYFIFSFALITVLTFMVFSKSLNNQFTNWDDNRYITDNSMITTLHKGNISNAVTTIFSSYVAGNYHPLTMLVYSMEYNLFQLNPKPYHVVNLLLHILNSFLVLYFIWLLTKQKWIALLTALFFAIHPMHVESVVWMSELKDLLYSLFYLSALCTYTIYIDATDKKTKLYSVTLLLFVLGVLSKAMAVSLPLALFAIDYFRARPFNRELIKEKIPFVILSMVFGYVAILAQKNLGAIASDEHYSIFERIIFSSFGFITYLWKLLFPVNLSNFYTYPFKSGGYYPVIYYIAPLFLTAILFFVYRLKQAARDVLFGVLFFCITIGLVIQLFPVGEAILADRYSYLPYIGLLYIIANRLNQYLLNEKTKNVIIAGVSVLVIIFSITSYKRSLVWKDTLTLWDDSIEKSDRASMPFYCRGWEHYQQRQYDKALDDYNKAIQLEKNFYDVYYSKGIVYAELGNYQEAINNYDLAIYYNDKFIESYLNRGLMYANLNKNENALNDYTKAISINPKYALAFFDRGIVSISLGKYNDAINDFDKAISLSFINDNVFLNRGTAYYLLKKYNDALLDFSKALELNPNLDLAYFKRGVVYFESQKYMEAVNDYSRAINLNPQFIEAYLNRSRIFYLNKQYDLALMDVQNVIRLGGQVNTDYIATLNKLVKQKH